MSFITYNAADGTPQILHTGPYIIVMCGLPGSGKSTLRGLFRSDAVQLSTDDLVEEIAQWSGKTYDQVWSDEIGAATAAVQVQFREAVKNRQSIIWDQTNLSVKKRAKILRQVPSDYYKAAIFVHVHEDLRQERLSGRAGKTIPKHIDASMRTSLQIPTEDEGFDAVFSMHMGPPHTGMKKQEFAN